jgi:uncharacterized protein
LSPNPTRRGGPVQPSTGALRPLGPDEISLVEGFWQEKQQLNADVILAHCESWMERIGWIGNFDRAADGTLGSPHAGIEFVDSEIYKLLEAMAWELGRAPHPELESRYRALVARVAAAQEPDGYLDTSFGRPGQQPRYSNLEWGHELYCFGHLIQAAVARLRSGVDDELPAIARQLADHIYVEFGPSGRVGVCGHPEIEVALAEFSRATGDRRYLELSNLFIERRGTGTLGPIVHGSEYFQDDMPVRDATVLRGHAVRALYLSAGAVDVAVETRDTTLLSALKNQWENTVARRTYITGGMGSHHLDEAFGADYELPPDRAYSETCAGIGSIMLSWRLQLETGDAKYADLIERTLLNNVLASPREDGRAFYYANTLHQRTNGSVPNEDEISVRAEASLRAPWFEVSCCPTNVARTLASVELYFATATDDGVQLHQYGNYDVGTALPGGALKLQVRSGYPFDGRVDVSVQDAPKSGAALTFRIPAWAAGASIDGNPVIAGANVEVPVRAGTVLRLDLPMAPRITHPHPYIDATRGTVAIERGPLVLVLESTDLPEHANVAEAVVDASEAVQATERGARAAVTLGQAPEPGWPYGANEARPSSRTTAVDLTPYFSWANRGPSTMRVWLPVDPTTARSTSP